MSSITTGELHDHTDLRYHASSHELCLLPCMQPELTESSLLSLMCYVNVNSFIFVIVVIIIVIIVVIVTINCCCCCR